MSAKILSGPSAPRSGERQNIQSVDRALLLLETIAEAGGEAALSDLAARTGINISTCHHLLNTLIGRGFASKVRGKRLYALGSRILSLGQACLQADLPTRSQPFIERLSRNTGETIHLAALQGDLIATLVKREGRHAVRVDTGPVGKTDAPHATASGKAMLAWLPEDEIRRITGDMPVFTEHTITDFAALIEELRQVRRNGYALDREEFQPGVICVGAAIRDHAGTVVAAVSASMPSMRADEAHLAMVRDEVMAAARALSAELGAPRLSAKPQAAIDEPAAAAVAV